MRYWLLKSEPAAYGIDDIARDKTTSWNGVRNYQALAAMQVLQRGNRLSIMPVAAAEWKYIMGMIEG